MVGGCTSSENAGLKVCCLAGSGLDFATSIKYCSDPLKKFGLPANSIYKHIEGYEASFTVYVPSPAIVLEAVRGVRDHRFSYDDAQISAAAKLNQLQVILSEDFNVGVTIEGVRLLILSM